MLCYRDMTFCEAACAASDCPRKLTADVKAAAARWWGQEGAPIAVSDYSSRCKSYEPASPDLETV